MQNIPLAAGDYTLAVSVFENMSFAENLGTGTLGDGFIGLGNYYSLIGGVRNSNYALELPAVAQITGVTRIGGDDPIPPAPQPPTLMKGFLPALIRTGEISQLRLVMHNPNGTEMTGAFFTDSLPAALAIAGPVVPVGCGGTVTAIANVIQLTNGTIAPNGDCVVMVNVSATAPAVIANLIPASAIGRTVVGFVVNAVVPAMATLTVVAPPQLSKNFDVPAIVLGETATLKFTVHNPNPVGLAAVAFTDTLPAGLKVASPNGVTQQDCMAATIAAAPDGTSIAVTGGGVANSSVDCIITVKVRGVDVRVVENVTSQVTASTVSVLGSSLALTGAAAQDSITVISPLQISKEFAPSSIQLASTTVLTLRVKNLGPAPATNVAFTDAMPASLLITSAGDIQSAGCGVSAVGPKETSNISLAGGTIAPQSECVITVTVQGLAPGTIQNTTSSVTGAASGIAVSGDPATATLEVGASETSFLVRYASNLAIGDSVVNITNTGDFSSVVGLSAAGPQNGNICANLYTYSPDEQLVSCCSCLVTPNALNTLSVNGDLTSNTLTPVQPSSVVIKMVASKPSLAGACNPATVTRAGTANFLVPGLEAWGSTLHPLPVTAATPAGTYAVAETPFVKGQISGAELTRMTQLCGFIQANGSGYGICKSCKLGGLGAASK